MAKIVSKNDPDTKKVWCKYGKIPGQGDGVNLFFVGEINVTHYFITNIGAGLPDACAEQLLELRVYPISKSSTS
ncbi:hypothetical protein EIZ89_00655 [Escherichia coli]|nr:hypothetical protein [Escherichia coli]HBN0854054.1 hypothetical protein [Escherichia coli]